MAGEQTFSRNAKNPQQCGLPLPLWQWRQFTGMTVVLLLLAASANAQNGTLQTDDPDQALAISQAAIGNTLSALTFTDVYNEPFELQQLTGKPMIVSLIYTSCFHICPMITENLARTIDIANEALGEDSFNVVSIGFDWAEDSPDRMRMFGAQHSQRQANWHFLSGDEQSITALSEDLGFLFARSAKGFDHLSQTTIIDRDGRVYRQVYGQTLDAPSIVEPLKELVFDTPREAGLITHWVDTFRLFCTVFDPNSGRYRFDYSILMTILTGILSLGAVGYFIMHEWRRGR